MNQPPIARTTNSTTKTQNSRTGGSNAVQKVDSASVSGPFSCAAMMNATTSATRLRA